MSNQDTPVFPEYPPTLPNVIADAIKRHGDLEFLIEGERRLTFRAAERESAHLARGLLAAGIGKGTRVAIIMPNCLDWVLAWWAAARIGAFTIPLSTFFQAREISWALNEADVDTLFICDRYVGHDYLERLERAVPELAAQTSPQLFLPSHPSLRRVIVCNNEGKPELNRKWAMNGLASLRALADAHPLVDDAFLGRIEAGVTPADWLMGICTSGSTSSPKIVIHTHGSIVRITHAFRPYSLGIMKRGERNYCGMPFFWLGGHNSNLFPAMYEGGCMVFAPSPRPEDIFDVIVKEKVTRVSMWPAQFKPLRELAASRGMDISQSVRSVDPRDEDGNPIPPERRIASLLGMTESFGPHGVGDYIEILPEKNRGSWGRSLVGLERKIVDPATGRTLPPGQDGELYIRGFPMMAGYYKRERGDVFDADGWFATGDTCCFDEDGYLYFKGRISEMIKTAGANVSPQEVEGLMATYEGVGEAVVIGLPDDVLGQTVLAVVVPRDGANIDAAALQRRMREEISSYKVPKRIMLMKFDDIPRTDAGKVRKNALRDLIIAQAEAGAGRRSAA